MISSIVGIVELADSYHEWLFEHGCKFDSRGFPIPKKSWYLNEWPDQMVPFRERHSKLVSDKSRTVLCLFCEDSRIYPRLEKVLSDIGEYREYMGVVGADVTVTWDMDIEWQEEIILLNQLFMAVLALNGIKVVQNMRIGDQSTLRCLSSVPKDIMCATGTLGCSLIESCYDLRFSEKIFHLRPSGVMLYGRQDPLMEEQLDVAGIPYRLYRDAHTIHKSLTVRKQS